jgi:hypothetical protein
MTCLCRSDAADTDHDVVASHLKIRAPKSNPLNKQRSRPAARTAGHAARSDNRLDRLD